MTAHSVVTQVKEKLQIRNMAKSADEDADDIDLSTLNVLVNSTPDEISSVMDDSGRQALFQLGIEDTAGLVGQVSQASLAYAKMRGAEMVGKKWVDGELVDNPDADWVITDATRDDIRDILASVYSGDLDSGDLADAIQDAGAFSDERAELIARTEVMNANAQGSLTGYRAARDAGVNVKKIWEPDANACPICQANADDGAIDVDSDFSSGDDAPPAHPNCECVLVPVVETEENTDDDSDA